MNRIDCSTSEATPQTPSALAVSATKQQMQNGAEGMSVPDAVRALAFLYPARSTFELCGIGPRIKKHRLWDNDFAGGKKPIVAGWFSDQEKAAMLAAILDAEARPEGIYVTLNPTSPALLGRADHRLKAGVNRTQDSEMVALCNLLLDADPVRPAGISATEAEKTKAREMSRAIYAFLRGLGWPDPLCADSGNGDHLVYKISLANTPENVALVKGILRALAARFDTDGVKVDQSVFNPARLVKLWGTMARKGDDTADRPHRRSAMLHIPADPLPVPRELLEALAAEVNDAKPPAREPRERRHDGDNQKLDVETYCGKYGVTIKAIKQHGTSTLYVIDPCVFNADHAGGEAAIGQCADGKLFYQCYHNSCQGRTWAEARRVISGSDSLFDTSRPRHLNNGSQRANVSQADEWEPDIRPWPSLSREALPGITGAFVELATRASEADPAAVLATFLTRFGAEVYGRESGKGPILYVGETKHYSRLFTAIIGASSKARKGTSAGPVKILFDFSAVPAALLSTYSPASTSNGPLSTGEGLAFAVRDARQEWVVDKKTKAGEWSTVDPGVEDKRLFVSDEEFAAALQCTKREGNTLSTAIRCFWDSGDYSPLVKRERTKATGAHVCIVTHITTHELTALLDDVQAFNGFGNRFLWVCARRQREVPFPARMPEDELSAIRHDLFNVVALAHECGVVNLDAQAREMWRMVYSDLSKDHPGLAGCIINRGEAQALRLALVYALLDGQNMIGEPHLRAGLAFWDYCKTSALYVFGGRESSPIADKLLVALKNGPLTTTDLHRVMGNHATKDTIKDALQSFVASGRIIQTEEKTAGKPRKKYALSEKSELCEITQSGCDAGEDNSLNSLNSPGGAENSGLWTGPAEVEI